MTALNIPLRMPDRLVPILQPRRFKILHGGRGGAKSHTVAQVLIAIAVQCKRRILCAREVQKSLKESSMQVIRDYITAMGLDAYFKVLKTEIVCVTTGSVFSFTGLREHTAHTIKSYEGVDIVWIEEANAVSATSWNLLIPTIRKPRSEIWATFNPDLEDDYVYDRFVKHTDADALVIQVSWRDNPLLAEEMHTERLKLKELNQDLYDHVWEGKCRSLSGLLFKRRWFKFYDKLPDRLVHYMATDFATTDVDDLEAEGKAHEPDWTEHGNWGLDHKGELYATDWWSGQEDPEVTIAAAVTMLRRNKPRIWFDEAGVIHRALNSAINKRLAREEPRIYVLRETLPTAGSKADRALGFAARCAAGAVWLPEKADWTMPLVNQLCAFTGQEGKTDDKVDVCSLIARGLDVMHDASPPAPPEAEPIKPFTRRHIEYAERAEARDKAERARYYR